MTRIVIRTGSIAILGLLFSAPISYSSTVAQPTLWKFYVGQPISAVKKLMNGVYAESRFDPNDQVLIAALEQFNVSTSDARAELGTVRALIPDDLFLRRLACGDARMSGIPAATSCARPLLDEDLKGVVVWIDNSDTVRAVRIQKGYSRFARPKTMIEDMVSQLGQPSSSADGSSHEATAGFGLSGVSLHDSPSFTYHLPASSERDIPSQQVEVQLYKDVITGSWARYHWYLQNAPKWSDSERFASIVAQVFDVQATTKRPKPAMAQTKSNEQTRKSPTISDDKVGTGPLLTSGRPVDIEGVAPLTTTGWERLAQFGFSRDVCKPFPVSVKTPDWVSDPQVPEAARRKAEVLLDSTVSHYDCRCSPIVDTWVPECKDNSEREVYARITESGSVLQMEVIDTYTGNYDGKSTLATILEQAKGKYGEPEDQFLSEEVGEADWEFRDYDTSRFLISAQLVRDGLGLSVHRYFLMSEKDTRHRSELQSRVKNELQAIRDDAMGEKQIPDVDL